MPARRVLLTTGLLASLAVAFPHNADRYTHISPRQVQSTYDYIIVGGGTSGLTVADRLTEDGKTTVLVIENGELIESTKISSVRGGFQALSAEFLYDITSVPQPNLKNRATQVMIGNLVGGGSAINMMMTVRGHKEDYDRWGAFFPAAAGAPEWSWDGLLPYFKRALNFVPPTKEVTESAGIKYDTSFWGNTSGVYTSWPSFQYPGTRAQMEAFAEFPGVTYPPDSGAGLPGMYWYPQYMDPRTATRSYARTGHYLNVKRDNYQLVTGRKVNKILFSSNGALTATGVTFVPAKGSGAVTTVSARKEVILAAGGIHTPHILQQSGIGPKKLLTAANIPVVQDLPGVGANFQDHPMLSARYSFRTFNFKPSENDLNSNATFRTWAQTQFDTNKTGPYTIATGNAAAWLPFPVISSRSADLATRLAGLSAASLLPTDTDATVAAGYQAQLTMMAAALKSNGTAFYNLVIAASGTSAALVNLHPLSRGTVLINPKSPAAEPIVDYRALTNPVDTLVMTDILKFTRRFYMDNKRTAAWGPVQSAPGAAVSSDAQFASYLADTLSPTEYHPVGTAAMMPRELGGVVDQWLKVYGVAGLRVVDGSMMPMLPGGNTCQTVYAVAEKAADIIKEAAEA